MLLRELNKVSLHFWKNQPEKLVIREIGFCSLKFSATEKFS